MSDMQKELEIAAEATQDPDLSLTIYMAMAEIEHLDEVIEALKFKNKAYIDLVNHLEMNNE
tara:strand:+ start:1890 stop:2072 length:183 start_codon:yes stop_codon:yes gene_type:complete